MFPNSSFLNVGFLSCVIVCWIALCFEFLVKWNKQFDDICLWEIVVHIFTTVSDIL